jgi:hypothetical protein
MNTFKKIALSAALMAAFASFSTAPAFAEENKDKNAVVRAAAEGTITKLQEAIAVAEKHGTVPEMLTLINEARQLQKEFRYEQTERLRQNGNNHLRAAREALDQGNLADAGEAAKKALEVFSEMYKTYAAAHK